MFVSFLLDDSRLTNATPRNGDPPSFFFQTNERTNDSLSSLCAAAGRAKSPPVVFLDTDILVVGSIVERVFGRIGGEDKRAAAVPFGVPASIPEGAASFDYCCTLSDSYDMPINFGIQFVAPGKTHRAAEFLKGVCSIYDFSATFTAGQEVRRENFVFDSDFFEI